MKLAFFVSQFPTRSQTFVLNQITGFIDAGVDVSIIALTKGDMTLFNEGDYQQYQLAQRCVYLTSPQKTVSQKTALLSQSSLTNIIKFTSRLTTMCLGLMYSKTRKRTFAALSYKLYGKQAKSLLLASIAGKAQHTYSYDVVLAHFGNNGITANNLRDLGILQGKLVTVFHGHELSVQQTVLANLHDYQRLFSQGDLMLPISGLWRDKLISLGCPTSKIAVHRMGVDLKHFPYQGQIQPVSSNVKAVEKARSLTLFTVARFTEKKGIIYALEALAIVLGLPVATNEQVTDDKILPADNNANANVKAAAMATTQSIACHYRLAGFGEELVHIKQTIERLSLEPYVTLLGPLSSAQVQLELLAADVFLQPSITANNGDMEGIPVSIMEAMAVGTVVISTYHSGIPELITHGEHGLLAPEKCSLSLANNILTILDDTPLREKLIENARKKIEQVADVEQLNKQLVNLLVSVIDPER